MKIEYETLIVRVSGINWGAGKLDELVKKASSIKPPLVRLFLKDESQKEIECFTEASVPEELRSKVKRVEVLLRSPLNAMARTDWEDNADRNHLNWGGMRGSGLPPAKLPMRGTPMFFRPDGATVDILGAYSGAPCFLVLNGPSASECDFDKFKLPGVMSFGVNNGGHLLRPNFWTCVDDPKRFMPSIWSDPKIQKFVPMAHFQKPTWDPVNGKDGPLVRDYPNVIGYRRNEQFVANRYLTETTINWGNHSDLGGGRSCMLAAIRMIHLLGFKTLYLVGCDFNMAPDQRYFFPEKRTHQAIINNNNSYKLLMDRFEALQHFFVEDGFHVYNTNPNSALKVFPMVNFDDAIQTSTIYTGSTTEGMYTEKDQPRRHDNK